MRRNRPGAGFCVLGGDMYRGTTRTCGQRSRRRVEVCQQKEEREGVCANEETNSMPMEGDELNVLQTACMKDDFCTAGALLQRDTGHIDEGTCSEGVTPLMIAARFNSMRSAQLLLSHGANVHARDIQGRTALMHASVLHGHPLMMDLLIAKGVDVNAEDIHGETAVQLAIRTNHMGALRLLIARGGSVQSSDHGDSPLITAAACSLPATKILIDAGADPSPTRVPVAEVPPAPSPLAIAAVNGNADVVCFLVEHVGVEKCGGDKEVQVALILAAARGLIEVLRALSSAFVKVGAKLVTDAIQGGCKDCIKFLLQRYEIKDATDVEDRLVVTRAIAKGMYKEVQWLLEKGIDVSGCSVRLNAMKCEMLTDVDEARFRTVVHRMLQAPAVQTVSWGWVHTESQTRAKNTIKRTQTPVAWRRGSRRVVLRGLFRFVATVDPGRLSGCGMG